MTIDIESLDQLVLDSDKIFLTPAGEKTLVKLLKIKGQIEDAITSAEKKLEETALKLNPNFTSIQADKIKVYYRAYGSRYYIDESQIAFIPKELYAAKTMYRADAKAIEKWSEEHKGMPAGIREAERQKSLKFSLKDEPEIYK